MRRSKRTKAIKIRAWSSTPLLRMDTHAYSNPCHPFATYCHTATPLSAGRPRGACSSEIGCVSQPKIFTVSEKVSHFHKKARHGLSDSQVARRRSCLAGGRLQDAGCGARELQLNLKFKKPTLQTPHSTLYTLYTLYTLQFGGRPSMSMSCCWTLAKNALANVAGCRLPRRGKVEGKTFRAWQMK